MMLELGHSRCVRFFGLAYLIGSILLTRGIAECQRQNSEPLNRIKQLIENIQKNNPEGFQDTRWAMNYDEVMKILTNKGLAPKEISNSLTVEKEVAGLDAEIEYTFVVGHLSEIFIRFLDVNREFDHYWRLKDMLSAKYGDPTEDKQDILQYGAGALLESKFVTNKTEIFLYHFIFGTTRGFGLTYTSKEMEEVEKLIKSEAVGDNL